MTSRVAFEAVKQNHQPRFFGWRVEPIEIDEIAVRCFPTLAPIANRVTAREHPRINGLQMPTRQPPRRAVICRSIVPFSEHSHRCARSEFMCDLRIFVTAYL